MTVVFSDFRLCLHVEVSADLVLDIPFRFIILQGSMWLKLTLIFIKWLFEFLEYMAKCVDPHFCQLQGNISHEPDNKNQLDAPFSRTGQQTVNLKVTRTNCCIFTVIPPDNGQ
jgi:hypothetical protein